MHKSTADFFLFFYYSNRLKLLAHSGLVTEGIMIRFSVYAHYNLLHVLLGSYLYAT
jgi:hypothetical protein